MKLGAYVVRRVVLSIPVLIGITLLTFGISWIANDGEMERAYLTERMTLEQRDQIVRQYGFDQPWYLQYFSYLKRLVTLDLGFSHVEGDRPITEVYAEFFPHTIELTLVAMVIAVLTGVALGTLTAIRKDSPVDHTVRFLALSGVSVPIFWLGLLLKFVFATTFPDELFAGAGIVGQAVFFIAALGAPLATGLLMAEALDAPSLAWRRLLIHVGVSSALVAFAFLAGWTFLALVLAIVAGIAYAATAALKRFGRARLPRRAWWATLVALVAGSLLLSWSFAGPQTVRAIFEVVPKLPLGGQFEDSFIADGEHPSLTDGPTGFILVDTTLARDWEALGHYVQHLILPGITLGYFSLAIIARMMRSSMLETLHLDYVRTARAKGLREAEVIRRHARRNALIPIATVVGLTFGGLLSGAVLTETIFQWPGLGRWSTKAIVAADTTSVMSFTLLVLVIYLTANLLVDLMYSILDPRVRLS